MNNPPPQDGRTPDATGRSRRRVVDAIGAAIAIFAVAIVARRAVVQCLTPDESLTVAWFIAAPWSAAVEIYDANNHVFFSLLARPCLQWFGFSEWTPRLPSVAAFVVYAATVFVLLRRTLGAHPLLRLAAGAVATLNPLVLDYGSAARGYGLSIACFALALDRAERATAYESRSRGRRRALLFSGLAAGAAAAANLTAAPALLGLAVAYSATGFVAREGRSGARIRAIAVDLGWFALPAAAVFLGVAGPALSRATRNHFYVGAHSLFECAADLGVRSLLHDGPEAFGSFASFVGAALAASAFAACVAAVVVGIRHMRRGARDAAADGAARLGLLVGGSIVVGSVVWGAAHVIVDLPLPEGRLGLSFVALGSLAPAAAAAAATGPRADALRRFVAAALLVVAAVQARSLPVEHYGEFPLEAGVKRAFEAIVRRAGPNPTPPIRVALANWKLEPSFNFYLGVSGVTWMAPVKRDPPPDFLDYDFALASRDIAHRPDIASVLAAARAEYFWSDEATPLVAADLRASRR